MFPMADNYWSASKLVKDFQESFGNYALGKSAFGDHKVLVYRFPLLSCRNVRTVVINKTSATEVACGSSAKSTCLIIFIYFFLFGQCFDKD